MSTVWEMVDDTDPRIIYTGDWHEGKGDDIIHEADEEPLNFLSYSGNVYNNTFHATSKNRTTVTFSFNGTSFLAVYGSLIPTWSNDSDSFEQDTNPADTRCYVDGNLLMGFATIGGPFEANSFPQPMSNNLICREDIRQFPNGTSPGQHQLVINNTITGIPFALDYIVYETMPNVTPVNSMVIQLGNNAVAESQDPHFLYGPGWVDTVASTKSTSTPGSYLKVNFTGQFFFKDIGTWLTWKVFFSGTAVSLYGVVGHGNISNSATYQLDDNPAQAFQLSPSLASSSTTFTNQQLFNLSSISAQEHMLVITHNGTSAGVPLEIQYLLVTSSPPAPPTVSDQPRQNTPSPQGSKRPNTGAIIGGVTGGAFFLVLIALTVYVLKKKGESEKAKMAEKPDPFYGSHHVRMSFDPYNSGGSTVLSPEGVSKAKSDSSYDPITQLLAMNTQDDPNDEWNQMRFGNLKLQQRLAVLQSRTLTGGTHSEDVPSGSSRVFHTDSGLRVTGEGVFSRPEDVVEVPPNYTES
ncbi:hypothetical protein K435DRAFT_878804 [Dendrothele bispora CBS 962.96]|uniref:Uncharacterized protein n=1 Tax=Dendrothele bispora (strain CBS 962.96) TaxID=1314807 RepID=A0A4S8KMK2_DENBC|nr:hypothetical protein K435DRAFT_878804 [Dendrothele bispora CBS 962.96]